MDPRLLPIWADIFRKKLSSKHFATVDIGIFDIITLAKPLANIKNQSAIQDEGQRHPYVPTR